MANVGGKRRWSTCEECLIFIAMGVMAEELGVDAPALRQQAANTLILLIAAFPSS